MDVYIWPKLLFIKNGLQRPCRSENWAELLLKIHGLSELEKKK